MKVEQLRNKLEQRKGQRDQLQKDIVITENKIQSKQTEFENHEKAHEIIKQVGIKTQQELQYNISSITSMALEAILDDPYKLLIEFVERRNKNECDIFFEDNGNKINPFDGGGGALDIAAFSLRVATWSMKTPKTRNILILDEPFKHLKGKQANQRMLHMLGEVARKLNLQIIMVSDERVDHEVTVEEADKLFEVILEDKVSKIKTYEKSKV